MYIPGLIISKHWIKKQDLTTTVDKHSPPNLASASSHRYNVYPPSQLFAGSDTIPTITTKSVPSLMNFQLPMNGTHALYSRVFAIASSHLEILYDGMPRAVMGKRQLSRISNEGEENSKRDVEISDLPSIELVWRVNEPFVLRSIRFIVPFEYTARTDFWWIALT
jgi:hypothetical protein